MPETTPIAVNESMADRPHGWPRLNAEGALEGPLITRDGDDAASGGGVADVPEPREIVARAGSVAVGDGVSGQGNRVALSREAYRSPLRCAESFIASSSHENYRQFVQTASGQGYAYRIDDGTVVPAAEATNITWPNPERYPHSVHSFPTNPDTDYFTRITLTNPHGVDLAGLTRLENLAMSACKCRLLDFRGLDALESLTISYASLSFDPGRSAVATIGLEDLGPLQSLTLIRVPDLGDVVMQATPARLNIRGCVGLRSIRFAVGGTAEGDDSQGIHSCPDLTSIRAPGTSLVYYEAAEIEGDDGDIVGVEHLGADFSANNLSAEALNQFFSDIAPGQGGLIISGNPGTAACDPTIATAKGYRVIVNNELVGVS